MNLTINREKFQDMLSISSRFTLSKISSVPVLQNGLITIGNNNISITTTNLNDFFHADIKTACDENFSFIVDIKKIAEFLSFIQQLKISLEIEKNKLTIKSDKTSAVFSTIQATDFPKIPEVKGKKYTLSKKVLNEVLPLIIFSASSDEARPVLSGVNFHSSTDGDYIVATDGFRLSLFNYKENKQSIPSFIISHRVLTELIKLSTSDIDIEFSGEEKVVKFTLADFSIYSRVIEGEFPPFQKVIPNTYKTRISFDRAELLRSIKLSSIFARDSSNIIVFKIKKEGLYISPKSKETEEAVIFQQGDLEGDEQVIAFNYKYVLDFLNNINEKKISFEMIDKNAPGVFKTEKNPNFLHVIMPVRTDD